MACSTNSANEGSWKELVSQMRHVLITGSSEIFVGQEMLEKLHVDFGEVTFHTGAKTMKFHLPR